MTFPRLDNKTLTPAIQNLFPEEITFDSIQNQLTENSSL